MSEQKISQAMEELKALSETDKQFMLGYAAGVVAAAKQGEQSEADSGKEDDHDPR